MSGGCARTSQPPIATRVPSRFEGWLYTTWWFAWATAAAARAIGSGIVLTSPRATYEPVKSFRRSAPRAMFRRVIRIAAEGVDGCGTKGRTQNRRSFLT